MDDAEPIPAVTELLTRLGALDGLVVAFSGGADSAFLLAAAVRVLGPDNVVAATAVSDSLATWEREPAGAFAAGLGVRHLWPTTHEIEREGYRANAGNRCYFCKAELLDVLTPTAEELGWPVATGTNADDAVAGFRPGIRAAAERGALTPLRDAGLTKDQIREQSRRWELPTWDKPAAACLSSRIAYGISITPARLARVDQAESSVRAAWTGAVPLTDLRVRDLGDGQARLEVDAAALAAMEDASESALREQVLGAVRTAGFNEVGVRAFRSGSMNDALRA
ncbi:ATP-dependent sacrificial sulfur transferase LarE [Propionibacteriaceae bacterium Y1700]|uniref:ATP-dependent sacrificial sulfur transferase LarE n=1 Tax=Microlunatus sp. Y1700 TaxID=3418487 RepID=UPI003DA6D7BE